MAQPVSHGLGFGNGSMIDHGEGVVVYRQTGKLLPAFKVSIQDVTGVSVRKATRQDKKALGASSLQQVLTLQGGGTTLAECAVNYGTAEKIETWLRAHPLFGAAAARATSSPGAAAPSASSSLVDELTKLAQLRDSGVLTGQEFDLAKARLLG